MDREFRGKTDLKCVKAKVGDNMQNINNNFDNIPKDLKKYPNWVLWKFQKIKGKKTKVPYQTNSKTASSVNPDTWTTFDNVLQAYNQGQYSGIGFVFTNTDITGIDIDHIISQNGSINKDTHDIISLFNSYTEYSPSGQGVHIYVYGKIPEAIKKDVEIYSEGRYFTITGDKICGDSIENRQDILNLFYDKYHSDKSTAPVKTESRTNIPIDDIQELLDKAFVSKNGFKIKALYDGNWQNLYKSQSEADQALCNYWAFWLNKDYTSIDTAFRSSGLYREKWNRDDYRSWTINKAIKDCAETYQDLITRPKGATLEPYIKEYDFTNKGLLDRFMSQNKDSIKYVNDIGMYIFWNGKKWGIEDDKRLGQKITDFIYQLIDELKKYIYYLKSTDRDEEVKTFAKISTKLKNLSVVKIIRENFINVAEWLSQNDLDTNDNILNCENGILDLDTFELSPHDRNMYCTKIANVSYNPFARCSNFLSSLDWIFPNEDTRRELQKAYGYSLGGSMEQQVFFIVLGAGENGKSTITAPFKVLCGEYYASLNSKSLEPKKDNTAPSSDFAKLIGVRCAISSEPKQGQKLDDGLLKTLAVGEELNARFMRQNEFTYNPKYKLWIPSNKLPVITNTEHGFWRRLIIFPCRHKPKKKILDFYKLYIEPSELPGVLNWALEGRKMLKEEGFTPTDEMIEALESYKIKVNPIQDFVNQCCIQDELTKIQTSELLQAYNIWAFYEGYSELKVRTFRDRLVDMGYIVKKADKNKSYAFGLNTTPEIDFSTTIGYKTSMEKLEKKTKVKIIPMQNKFKI